MNDTYKSYIGKLYTVQPTKKKLVHVYLEDWQLEQIAFIQKEYKDVTGIEVSAAQIIRKAITEHTGKVVKSIKWHKSTRLT